jgi:hypothetical protein
MKRTSQAGPKQSQLPQINAKFQQRLPYIMNDICEELLVIEPAVNRLAVHLEEIFDYLDYEIKKVDLDLKILKLESRDDLVAIKAMEDWLNQLQQLKVDFNINVFISPPESIRAMVSRFQKMFGLVN